MRMLMIHVSQVSFWAVKEAIERPPDLPSKFEGRDCVVGFISVEENDTPDLADEAARELAEHARRNGVSCIVVYPFAHLSPSLAPPDMAAPMLRLIEEKLKIMGFSTVRAPFGWYKGFSITCPGHPACELSRTIETPRGPWFLPGDGRRLGIKEAIGQGLLPKEIEQGNPWDSESIGVQLRLGITSEGLTRLGEVMIEQLALWASERLGSPDAEVRPGGPGEVYGVGGLLSVIKSCLDAARYRLEGPVRLRSGLPGADVIVAPGDVGEEAIVKTLSELSDAMASEVTAIESSISRGLSMPYDVEFSTRVLLYRTRGGGMAPLAVHGEVRGNQFTCLGPLYSIASSIIDMGLRVADKGQTPSLPFWLAPVQVAVIPVKEAHVQYAQELLAELQGVGARAYLDPPTRGLGARVRAAGRLWVPIIAVVGDKEVQGGTVSVRRRWAQGQQEVVQVDELVNEVAQLVAQSPGRQFRPPVEQEQGG